MTLLKNLKQLTSDKQPPLARASHPLVNTNKSKKLLNWKQHERDARARSGMILKSCLKQSFSKISNCV